jgi:hypothetical protein
MLMQWMFIEYMNLILCLGIFIVGYLAYRRKKDKLAFNIAIAFGLFAVIHLVMLLRIRGINLPIMAAIKAVAYLIILTALAKIVSQKA